MAALIDRMSWEYIPIPAGAVVGTVRLGIGYVGSGHPIGLITAGVHGDEGPWGAWAIRKLLMDTQEEELLGSLRVVPTANPLAMQADARNAPLDTLDLNRVFPGDPLGSHTERLAAMLVVHAIDGAEIVIDLHGGGSWCVNAFVFQFAGGETLSRAFPAPFVVSGPDRSATLTGYARSQGATVTAVEMGGRSEFEEQWAQKIALGLRSALQVAGILKVEPSTPRGELSIPVGPTTVLRPNQGGLFVPRVRAGDVGTIVPGGTVLGYLHDPVTQAIIETFEAPFVNTALLLLRPTLARLEGGAMTYVVAEPTG
jgi:hypothetical protein